ncbi:hypothetical protein EDD18DRAFT_1108459 [Armillaria luteobubalina]|uniref:Uncharacterized protein n=1 Tax=Armillaria luteobubalina TaxID=153913 RepID=A0AA39PYB6_9AGAR|nr:hypothetical protein EDD18DRAFT_1108459 [Armillaria luteobubalina]
MKGLALGRYGNVNEAPCAELSMENNFDVCCTGLLTNFGIDPSPALPPRLNSPSVSPSSPGATTSQRCWEQAQPLAAVNQNLLQTISIWSIIPTVVDNLDSIKLKNFKHKRDQEWILESGINQGNIDALLTMMIKQGGQFESSTFTVPLQGQPYEFTVYHRDLWSWTLDILQDPLLAPYLNWDAQRLFKVNGNTSQRFYMEPHTSNMFWEIQTTLPDGRKPICYIIYANKMRLSSFGMVQDWETFLPIFVMVKALEGGVSLGGYQL